MNSQTATGIVIVGVGTAVVATVIDELTADQGKRAPAIYVPLGGVLVAVPLMILADVEPQLAAMLGGLIGIGAILLHNKALLSITGTLKATSLPTQQPPKSAQNFSPGQTHP